MLIARVLCAFEESPYFGDLAEFYFRPAYSYRYYPDVDRGFNPRNYSSNDHMLDLNLGVRFLPNWEFQGEVDFAATSKLSPGMRRAAILFRYLILDDVAGDPISLVAGMRVFYVPTRQLSDVSSPYHAQGNAQISLSIGKEISRREQWLARFYVFLGVGSANRGFPWVHSIISSKFQWKKRHELQLFSKGYFGFGNRHRVNVDRFNGYAKISHRSIDVGLGYCYLFSIWGSLGIQYAYRVYARAFPERAHTVTIAYTLPFSVL